MYDGQGENGRLVKNVFLFYFEISDLFGTIQCVCRYQNLPLQNRCW